MTQPVVTLVKIPKNGGQQQLTPSSNSSVNLSACAKIRSRNVVNFGQPMSTCLRKTPN